MQFMHNRSAAAAAAAAFSTTDSTAFPTFAAQPPIHSTYITSSTDSLPSNSEQAVKQQNYRRFSTSLLGKVYRFSVWLVCGLSNGVARLLEWLMPHRFGAPNVESGSGNSRARNIAGKWNATFIQEWWAVMRYLVVFVCCAALLLLVLVMGHRDSEAFRRARRSEVLLKHCHSHEDRVRVLREPSMRVPSESFVSGILPCGARMERLKERLIHLHREHADDEHRCLTAKHLNHTYSIISVLQSDTSVTFLFNPEKYAPVSSALTIILAETSDFFPLHSPVNVTRPRQAWISYTDSAGTKQRVRFNDATLYCILHAWEVLSGEHYLRFQPELEPSPPTPEK